jgi:prepilin-type N-terminal cleavage/methylation domain-containing protein
MPKFTSVACPSRPSAPLPHSDERGFTIVELTVALGLLAIVAASIAGVFYAAIRTAGTASHRTAGAAIASRELESMRSFTYTDVGFYADQTGYVSQVVENGSTFTTVTLGASTPSTPANIQPLTPDPNAASGYAPDPKPENANYIVQGGVKFSVARSIVWVDAQDSSTAYAKAYKRLTVVVTWSDQVGLHNVRQDSLLYPGGQGPYAGPEGVSSATTVPPTTVALPPTKPNLISATPATDPQGQTEIDLTWNQPSGGSAVTSYTIQFSTDSSFPTDQTSAIGGLPPGATSYPVTGLAANTTYYFEVIAIASPQTSTSDLLSAKTLAPPGPAPCSLGPLLVKGATSLSTTGTILKKHGNRAEMSESLTLSFSTTGTCTASYSVKAVSPSGADDPGPWYALTNNGTGSYTGSVLSLGQTGWAVGLHTFTVWENASTKTAATKTFTVCAVGSKQC